MQVTRFGHAALLVEAVGQRILIDPGVFSAAETFELTGLAAIVVTHQHPDHIDADRIARLLVQNPAAVRLSDPETAAQFPQFKAHQDGSTTEVGDVTITGVGVQHAEILPSIPRIANVGVLVSADGEHTLFHPGDSYAAVPDDVGILALPLTAPWTKVSETVEFARRVSPSSVFPIHDAGATVVAHQMYWGHVVKHSGVSDTRDLGATESATFV